MTIKEVILDNEKDILINFLNEGDLEYENDIDYSIIVYDQDKLIATASLSKNIMKCFLVSELYKGKNITNLMFSHLANILRERNIYHYFVFTKTSSIKIFTSLNMNLITSTSHSALLEGGEKISNILEKLKSDYNLDDKEKSALVINANPMTKGHLYLIEQACKLDNEVLVFVVSEDSSTFPFNDRFAIIEKATSHLEKVKVLPSLNYLVSHITFPKYFLKEDSLIRDEQALIDVQIFKEYYIDIFNITKRFVGNEPLSFNTSKYNQVMKKLLKEELVIVDRTKFNKEVISASKVRELIKNNQIELVKDLVPEATFDFLLSKKGKEIINKIQLNTLGRH